MKRLIELILGLFKWPDVDPVKETEKPSQIQEWIGLDKFAAATGLNMERAQFWYPHVRAACIEFQITQPKRLPAFLSQVGHESGGFRYTREIWGPTKAQKRYEGRADLGNTEPGDGSKFRGRGLIQVTGRYGYEKASKALGVDLIKNPELLEEPAMAAKSAAWWWSAHGCNELADAGDYTRLTKRINGGTNGLDDRLARWDMAKEALA